MSRIPRVASTVFLGAFWLASASGVRAATLSLVTDDFVYDPGDTVTIALVGDSQGATDNTLFAALTFDPVVLVDPHVDRFMPPPTAGNVPWSMGGLGCPYGAGHPYGPTRCVLLNAIYPDIGTPGLIPTAGVDPANEPFTYAVLTATAGISGVHTLDFVTDLTQRVDFFGLTSAPGITITITGEAPPPPPPPPPPVIPPPVNPPPPAVPEPGAALLFAAGVACVRLRLRRGARA